MTEALEGKKYWKHGDSHHVWVVDAIVRRPGGRGAFAILVTEDGRHAEDVDVSHLLDPEQYIPVAPA